MSKQLAERESQGSDAASTEAAAPAVGKHTRTEGIVARGEGQGDGVGAPNGPATPAGPGGPGTAAKPAAAAPAKVTSETDQKAPGGAPKTRTTVAIGEKVYFTADTAPEGASWKASAGSGKADGANYDWDAPSTPTSAVTITFDPGGGVTPTTVQMTVIGPSSIEYFGKTEQGFGAGVAGAGMVNKLKFLPMSVCFWGTQWRETDVDATNVSGWFSHVDAAKLKHTAAPERDIGDDNKGPKDIAAFTATGPYNEKGSFSWVIPQQYSFKGSGTWTDIGTPFTQLTTIDAKGTLTVTKNGQTVTRKL